MQASEMRSQSIASLRTMLKNLATQWFQLRMQHGSGGLRRNHELKSVRKDIARVKTVITELERGQGSNL